MYPPLNEASKAFYNVVHAKKHTYPFWALLRTPVFLELAPMRYFGCLVMHHGGEAFIGFKESIKRNEFQSRYGGEDWTP